VVILMALTLPYLSFSSVFGFVRLPGHLLLAMIGLILAYVAAVELAKRWFYRFADQSGAFGVTEGPGPVMPKEKGSRT
jgi:hypothetical protein